MAITSVGYDGSVNESQWAKLIPLTGSSHYGVAESSDWKVTPHATMDRGVNIAVGTGWGHGILDTSDATVSLQGAVVGAGSRWDCVVVRRNWSGTGGTTQFLLIQGTATKQIPSRNTTPGTIDDQPIALVQFTAGQTAPQQIIDLRCFARNGGMVARDELALTYLKEPGSTVTINDTTWLCTLDTNGQSVWTSAHIMGKIPLFGIGGMPSGNSTPPAGMTQFLVQAGSTILTTDSNSFGKLIYPNPFPNGLISINITNGDDWAFPDMSVGVAGGDWGTNPANRFYTAFHIWGNSGGSRTRVWHNKTIRVNWIAIGW